MIEINRKLDKSTFDNRLKDIYHNGIISPNVLLNHGIIDGYIGFDTIL